YALGDGEVVEVSDGGHPDRDLGGSGSRQRRPREHWPQRAPPQTAAIWMRFPQVSSNTAVIAGPIWVGPCVNVTSRSRSRSYSACTSSTRNWAAGIPSAISASR